MPNEFGLLTSSVFGLTARNLYSRVEIIEILEKIPCHGGFNAVGARRELTGL